MFALLDAGPIAKSGVSKIKDFDPVGLATQKISNWLDVETERLTQKPWIKEYPAAYAPPPTRAEFVGLMVDALQKHGWKQGKFGSKSEGFCLYGALEYVANTRWCWDVANEVRSYLDHKIPKRYGQSMMMFNDMPWRKKDQVINFLRDRQVEMAIIDGGRYLSR